MKQEYIVVNKTKLLERIAELKENNISLFQTTINFGLANELFESVVNNSTPLEPIVSDAWTDGAEKYYDSKEEYINNLKLDI